jgi:signal transduction histidine kinase
VKLFTAILSGRTWTSTIYVVTGLFIGIPIFTATVTLTALGFGLIPLALVGLGVLAIDLVVASWFGRFERARLAATLGREVPAPISKPMRPGFLGHVSGILGRGEAWRAVLYGVQLLPVQAIGFTFVITAWVGGWTCLSLPIWAWTLPDGGVHLPHAGIQQLDKPISAAVWLVPIAIGGAVLIFAAPWIARGWAAMSEGIVVRLLGPSKQDRLSARVTELTETRSRVVDAADAERRRIERDLHDGAQQRLVALAVELGRAKARLAADPAVSDDTRELVAGAHVEAKLALAEIRDLVRGIHPAVLTDRGLDAALSALAARSPVPVSLDIDLSAGDDPRATSPAVEAVAYFVVAEVLTNTAKHAGASAAAVVARVDPASGTSRAHLLLSIRDNGQGGADPAGEGLRGLTDRVAALDGTLVVTSPPGGPTSVDVAIPVLKEGDR